MILAFSLHSSLFLFLKTESLIALKLVVPGTLLFSLLHRSLVCASHSSASQVDAVTVSFYMDFEDPNFSPSPHEASALCTESFSPLSDAKL